MFELNDPLKDYPDIKRHLVFEPNRRVFRRADGNVHLYRAEDDYVCSQLSPTFARMAFLNGWCSSRPVGELPVLDQWHTPSASVRHERSPSDKAVEQGYVIKEHPEGWAIGRLAGRTKDNGFRYELLSPYFKSSAWLDRWLKGRNWSSLEAVGHWTAPPIAKDGNDEKSRRITEYLVMHGRSLSSDELDRLLEAGPPADWDGQ